MDKTELLQILERYENDISFMKRKLGNIETILITIAGIGIWATIKQSLNKKEQENLTMWIHSLMDSLDMEED